MFSKHSSALWDRCLFYISCSISTSAGTVAQQASDSGSSVSLTPINHSATQTYSIEQQRTHSLQICCFRMYFHCSISTSAEAAAQKAVDSAQQLVTDLKSTQLHILDVAPADIKASSWFKDYYKGVQDINATCKQLAAWPKKTRKTSNACILKRISMTP